MTSLCIWQRAWSRQEALAYLASGEYFIGDPPLKRDHWNGRENQEENKIRRDRKEEEKLYLESRLSQQHQQ